MFMVRMFLETSIKGPRKGRGQYGYLLETVTPAGNIRTLHAIGQEEEVTANQLHLKALIAALSRMNQTCEIEIFTDSTYIRRNYENLSSWAANGWLTAHQESVKNRELWEKVYELGRIHLIRFGSAYRHEYKSWLVTEMQKQAAGAQRKGA